MFESLDEIRTFVRVVDAKSLSGAARALRVSVNAVWRRLERIEERAGTRLVERTTRSLRVTEAGERVARRARRILDELQETERDVAAGAERLRGSVRVAVSSDVASGPFLLELGQLLGSHPELRVELYGRSRLVEPVAAGVDIMVWVGPISTTTSTVRRLGTMDWALAASPDYVARRGLPARPEDLESHDCLTALRGARESTWTLVDGAGEARSVRVGGQFESDAPEILAGALAAGLGIGIRPLREVQSAAQRGLVVHVLPGFRFSPLEIALVTPSGRLRAPHVRAVADLLTRRLRALAGTDGG
ncbi:MAG: LysR family transcriptional regulator [Polyangiaceae bacterium]